MAKITYRIILVIGDNHKEIVKKYSADTPNNENAYYKYERCQQHRLEVTGEEGDFSDPFPLKDGGKSYSAHFNDIDWAKIHRNPEKMKFNERVWDLVINDDNPHTVDEVVVKKMMINRLDYFINNFKSKEEYINHSSNLWYWGVATEDKYEEVKEGMEMDWCVNFYDRFLKGLEETNPLITIYETHSLD